MNLHVHIDRVVLDAPLDVDGAGLEAAITRALVARLEHGAPPAADDASLRGHDIDLRDGHATDLIAHAVAVALMPGGDQ